MRKLLAGLGLVVFAVVFYNYYGGDSSKRVRTEMLRLVGDMELSDAERAEAQRLVETFHDATYQNSLDIGRKVGSKFDEKSYYDELFARMTDQARSDGNSELAQKLSAQKDLHSLHVTER